MSRFMSDQYASLRPYVPGEQPVNVDQMIKLNTNESPYPPDEKVMSAMTEAAEKLALYPDPDYKALIDSAVQCLQIRPDQIVFGNGSDDILNLAFMAFCDENRPAYFPDITYGFYSVFADLHHIHYEKIPLKGDFSVDLSDYRDLAGTIFLANPNAPTGKALSVETIESFLKVHRDHVVVVDEAYVDFGAESCMRLIDEYDHLLVIRTFSKSGSLAGGRLGYAMGHPDLIRDLNTLRFSTNPYNVSRMTAAGGCASFQNEQVNRKNCRKIMATRERTAAALKELGFEMTDSLANFLFVRYPDISGENLYEALKAKGILIRHFDQDRIRDYNRITVGSDIQMEALLNGIREIFAERQIG